MRYVVWVVTFFGCVSSGSVPCGDLTCPAGTQCATVTTFDGTPRAICATQQEIDACAGFEALAPCGDGARCYEGVCLPEGCGNGLRDPGEVCDDLNTAVGDGCSADCRSNETCPNGVIDLVNGETCDDGDSVGHDGCSALCETESLRWTDLHAAPRSRYGAAAAYDTARDVVILFGGHHAAMFNNLGTLGDLWEWNGERWTQRPVLRAPDPRAFAAMAYDAHRGRTVLYGGAESAAEVWEWNGADWTRSASSPNPGVRANHEMVYDSKNRRIVLYGGNRDGGDHFDTWTYDGSWTVLHDGTANTPHPRVTEPAMTYDSRRGVVMLYGEGGDIGDRHSQLWELSGATWRLVKANAVDEEPTSEIRQLAWDPRTGDLILSDPSWSNWYAWNGTVWTAFAPTLPPSSNFTTHVNASLISLPRTSQLLLLDQNPTGLDERMFVLDNNTWLQPNAVATPPLARRQMGVALDRRGHRVLLVGGQVDNVGATGELWQWTGRWTQLESMPEERIYCSAAYHDELSRLVVVGGMDISFVPHDDSWVFDGVSWTPSTETRPSARIGAAMAYDADAKSIVLFGGASETVAHADTWVWNGVWTKLTPLASPPARLAAGMVFDPIARRVVMFGGRDANDKALDDTWEWDGTAWTEVDVVQRPLARATPLAWDGARQRVVMFSGSSNLTDLWELDRTQGTWVRSYIEQPPRGRLGFAMTGDIDGAGVFVFGGSSSGPPMREAMLVRWDGAPAEVCVGPDTDGDGLGACDDADCWAVCTPMCPPGAPCSADSPRCGDNMCDAPRESCTTCPADCDCAAACGDHACQAPETALTCAGDCP